MESVYSPKYGVLTFLNQGDKVFDANFTKSLIENAGLATRESGPNFDKLYKEFMSAVTNTQSLETSIVNNFYLNDVQDSQSMIKQIRSTVEDVVKENNKKMARDIRSLR